MYGKGPEEENGAHASVCWRTNICQISGDFLGHFESWSVQKRNGLNQGWEKGLTMVVIETDSAQVFQILSNPDSPHSIHDVLAHRCKSFLRRPWVVRVSKIFREANFAADRLANWAITQPVGFHLLPRPPEFLARILEADIRGVGCSRFVPTSDPTL